MIFSKNPPSINNCRVFEAHSTTEQDDFNGTRTKVLVLLTQYNEPDTEDRKSGDDDQDEQFDAIVYSDDAKETIDFSAFVWLEKSGEILLGTEFFTEDDVTLKPANEADTFQVLLREAADQ